MKVEEILPLLENKVKEIGICLKEYRKSSTSLPFSIVRELLKVQAEIDALRDLYIYQRFIQGQKQKELAETFGLSRGRISQIVKKLKQETEDRKTDV